MLLTGSQGRQPGNWSETGEVFHLRKDADDILISGTALKTDDFQLLLFLRHNLSLKSVGTSPLQNPEAA